MMISERKQAAPPVDVWDWHKWFAWHPVKTKTDSGFYSWAWFEHIERKRVPLFMGGYVHLYRIPRWSNK